MQAQWGKLLHKNKRMDLNHLKIKIFKAWKDRIQPLRKVEKIAITIIVRRRWRRRNWTSPQIVTTNWFMLTKKLKYSSTLPFSSKSSWLKRINEEKLLIIAKMDRLIKSRPTLLVDLEVLWMHRRCQQHTMVLKFCQMNSRQLTKKIDDCWRMGLVCYQKTIQLSLSKSFMKYLRGRKICGGGISQNHPERTLPILLHSTHR